MSFCGLGTFWVVGGFQVFLLLSGLGFRWFLGFSWFLRFRVVLGFRIFLGFKVFRV